MRNLSLLPIFLILSLTSNVVAANAPLPGGSWAATAKSKSIRVRGPLEDHPNGSGPWFHLEAKLRTTQPTRRFLGSHWKCAETVFQAGDRFANVNGQFVPQTWDYNLARGAQQVLSGEQSLLQALDSMWRCIQRRLGLTTTEQNEHCPINLNLCELVIAWIPVLNIVMMDHFKRKWLETKRELRQAKQELRLQEKENQRMTKQIAKLQRKTYWSGLFSNLAS